MGETSKRRLRRKSMLSKRPRNLLRTIFLVGSMVFLVGPLPSSANVIQPLTFLPPDPDNLDVFVRDREAAVRLGKALFWDEQVGSDGRVACATCHHQAGADSRITNRVAPRHDGFQVSSGHGATLTVSDFPYFSNDVVGSGGVAVAIFNDVLMESEQDDCVESVPAHGFRQVTERDAQPSVNANFNEEQFWDGRAGPRFNGVDGSGDLSRLVIEVVGDETRPVSLAGALELNFASAASQAVGPPNSDVEMACGGRTFPKLGAKMLSLRPLALQMVHPQDSHLGGLALVGGGLESTYPTMIRAAFHPRWWDSDRIIEFDSAGNPEVEEAGAPSSTDEFTVMEANFSLFWGLAIQLYEAELVSNQTPFDFDQLSRSASRGLDVFDGDARCDHCHDTALFTTAIYGGPSVGRFANTAVRPAVEDQGSGGGRFKTSGLRNVELTGPYFHNGSHLTLRDVVDFYDRGGDFHNGITDSSIRPLGLSERDKDDLVQFMLELTDDRVRCESAPFDHPSLAPPDGESKPAVGRLGRDAGDCLEPVLAGGDELFHFKKSEDMEAAVPEPSFGFAVVIGAMCVASASRSRPRSLR